MTSRDADGNDKIAAFERGMSDSDAALAFETPGVTAYVVDETYLVAYAIDGATLVVKARLRLYDGQGTLQGVNDFLEKEATIFGCTSIVPLTC